MIRPARPADAAGIAMIWNPIIRDTLVTFNAVQKSLPEVAALVTERQAAGHGFFVAEGFDGAEGVSGFATYAQFRGGVGYARTMEHTVLLAEGARGRGLGRALMTVLEDHARAGGAQSIFAGVSAANPEGRAFHAALGYVERAVLPRVGQKFGHWLDLILMQKFLA
jgi:L-amino acid N-acyltransferase YncA